LIDEKNVDELEAGFVIGAIMIGVVLSHAWFDQLGLVRAVLMAAV